jgi:phosphonate transport system ATP-binding protein
MSDIIKTSALKKSYANGRPVLAGIDLRIGVGERIALIGSNGTGKSTLLKCLIGHTPFCSGEVATLGETFRATPDRTQLRRMRQRIGFVFQNHGLVRRQSVLTNVVHGKLGLAGGWRAWHQAIARQEFRDQAMDALAQVNLTDKASARADELSGGQAQRVAIARALIRQPALMIADEPAASLDPTAGRDVMEVFSDLVRKNGITLVFTTHDMEHAVSFSDRIIALKGGHVHFDLPASAVRRSEIDGVFSA